jgi:hypothetical protein
MYVKPIVRLFAIIILFTSVDSVSNIIYSQDQSESEVQFNPLFGFSGSYSHNSFKAWGTMENTRQAFLNIQFIHSELSSNKFRVQLGSELIVAGWIQYPNDGINGPRESVIGLGLVPIRFNLPFSDKENSAFLTSSAGVLMTDKAFPDHRGTRLNYILEIGLGYQFRIGSSRLLHAGYKLHHLSNGNSAAENPGIDSHMLFIGLFFHNR